MVTAQANTYDMMLQWCDLCIGKKALKENYKIAKNTYMSIRIVFQKKNLCCKIFVNEHI